MTSFRPKCLRFMGLSLLEIALVIMVCGGALRAQQPPPAAPPKPPVPPPAKNNPFENVPQTAPPAPAVQAPKPEAPGEAAPIFQDVIEAVEFRGVRRVPQDTLRAMIFTKKGDKYDEDAIHRDFIALWNTQPLRRHQGREGSRQDRLDHPLHDGRAPGDPLH